MSDVRIGARLECRRCGHAWNTRTERRPVQCPRCKSTGWEGERDLVQMGDGTWMDLGEVWEMQKKIDWTKHPAFGMLADLKETDEELLSRIRRGWEPRDYDSSE